MSVRTTPPFRADHVGSLLRPPILLRAREDAARGAISPADLRAAEDDAIRDAVRMQDDIGLRSVTDGEFRRASWHMDFIYEIAGVQKAEQNLRSVFHNEAGDIEFTPSAIRVTGKLGMDHTIFGSAFEFLRDTAAAVAPETTPKLTIPAPAWSTTAAGRQRSTRPYTPTSTCSGRTSARPTPTRSGGWPISAVPTSS